MSSSSRAVERRRKLVGRALPIGIAAALAFLAGALLGSSSSEEATAAKRFAQAWSAQDFEGMHRELTPAAREEYPLERFRRAYTEAQAAVTAVRVSTGEVEVVDSSQAAVDVALDTHAFGRLEGRLDLPLDEAGRIDWEPHLVFFGLGPGERLDRVTDIGARGKILARDGTPLAEGPATARSSPLGAAALAIAGSVGSPSRKQEKQLHARGFPPDAPTGTSGLELAFNDRLAGRPGGQLLAVPKGGSVSDGRVLASSEPVDGRNVKTTIDPKIQQAAVEALGGLYGGVAALDVDTGQVLAVAGLAFSAPQPPGSTFKVITATAALDAGVVKTDDTFPVEVSNSKIGREIANSSDAPCGGTFVESFANSCNTVFAPLGVEVGGEKLVETAEAFGFNEPPSLMADEAQAALDPPASTIPNPIEGDVAVGESAIGQGQVLATPLQMASVAQTIANGGTRLPTQIVRTRELRPDAEPVEVTSPETAATVKDLMVEVVRNGTGRAAALPDVQVAGKTGTAELGPKALEPGQELAEGQEPEQELDAWFTAFAPAGKPKVAVAVMIVNATGDGGVVAAPIAREVLAAAL